MIVFYKNVSHTAEEEEKDYPYGLNVYRVIKKIIFGIFKKY